MNNLCQTFKYDCHCYDEGDALENEKRKNAKCGGQASWHPGWRQHRIRGHMAAAMLLDLLEVALNRYQQVIDRLSD